MTIGVGVFALLLSSCLQSITVAVPLDHPTNTNTRTGSGRNVSNGDNVLEFGLPAFPNLYAESDVASRQIKPTFTSKGSGSAESSLSLNFKETPNKRDAELEADSANGKSPIPLLFKRNEIDMNKLFDNENDYSGFPPYKSSSPSDGQVRYQRQRRSSYYPIESIPSQGGSSHSRIPDELEVGLDNDRDREAFLRLMTLLASRDASPLSNYNNLLNTEDNFGGDEDDEAPLDLGYYGDQQEWLDEAIPLQSHYKTRRSDDSLFRYNPAKSHFRRYQRNDNSRSFYPAPGSRNRGMLIRKRRNSNSVVPFRM